MGATANSQWIARVRILLGQGLGSEDIAVLMSCNVEDVRREIQILREQGDLKRILDAVPMGKTATKLTRGN